MRCKGVIAWDGRGNTRWQSEDVATLCGGAEQSLAPSHCFRAVMSGHIEWGGGTRWNPRNALNLCRGSRGAQSKPLTVIESRSSIQARCLVSR